MVFQSPQFTFLVGEEETRLSIHAAVLDGLSGPLNAMVNNGMKESISRVAVLKDVEVEIFAAFCEFAYTGLYQITLATLMNRDTETGQKTARDKPDVCSKDTHTKVDQDDSKLQKNEGSGLDLRIDWLQFKDREYVGDERWPPLYQEPEFSFQLKIYFFATRYFIKPLRQYCLECLHADPSDFKLSHKNSQEIFDALEFIYRSPDGREPTSKSCIRDLMIHYVACKFTILSHSKRYTGLLDSSPDFATDLHMAMKKWRR